MIIRQAKVSDAENCWRIRNLAIRYGCKNAYTPDEIRDWTPDAMPDVCIKVIRENPYFVIEGPDSKLLATGFLDIEARSVEAIFTLPEYVGLGLATRILCAIKDEANRRGFEQLFLSATPNAQSFYEKHSFKFVEETFTRSGIAKRKLRGIEMVCDLKNIQ